MTSTCRRPMSGFQSRLSTFTQISPGFETFGWKILVRKKPAFRNGDYSHACGQVVLSNFGSVLLQRAPSQSAAERSAGRLEPAADG